jgi:hypothetical protein
MAWAYGRARKKDSIYETRLTAFKYAAVPDDAGVAAEDDLGDRERLV